MIPSFVLIVKSLEVYDWVASSDAAHIDSYVACILHDKTSILTSVRLVRRDATTLR